jgi:hypothetical protein
VPIHGEKTNILFHPTPSVSYEPMFEVLEKRAGALCIAILLSVIIFGKMFGGSLKGLIPLGMCLASGIWLWMKEVIRSGREVEWSSEQSRGETVSSLHLDSSCETLTYPGCGQPPPRIGGMDEHLPEYRLGIDQP